ncbi:MAG: hypothetical protein RLZZ500_210 [Bacteroidota bacterium]|jgi:hypothetical protein
MGSQQQIEAYLAALSATKRMDIEVIHQRILKAHPQIKLWFLDGKDTQGKIVTNPNIGYGHLNLNYADGSTKEFYQVGISATSTGLSVYIMGLQDKKYLAETYGAAIGKAQITGYCIKFKSVQAIHVDVLEAAILDGLQQTA